MWSLVILLWSHVIKIQTSQEHKGSFLPLPTILLFTPKKNYQDQRPLPECSKVWLKTHTLCHRTIYYIPHKKKTFLGWDFIINVLLANKPMTSFYCVVRKNSLLESNVIWYKVQRFLLDHAEVVSFTLRICITGRCVL